MAYYYSTSGGFYESQNKSKKIKMIEGVLIYMWQRDAQPHGQYHIYRGIEVGLGASTGKYSEPYAYDGRVHASSILSYWDAYSKDVVFLDMDKTLHGSVIQNLIDAYQDGRLKPGVKLKFEFFDDENIPERIRRRWGRTVSIRVFINDSEASESVYYSQKDFHFIGLQPMIDDFYSKYREYMR